MGSSDEFHFRNNENTKSGSKKNDESDKSGADFEN